MRFLASVQPERFDEFVKNHPTKSHFMQSPAWGEFNRVERGMTPYYVGMEDESGNLVAAALLLERKPPLFPPYFYSPRGFVVDFFDRRLLESFAEEVAAYCKKRGAMFLKIDPDIEYREIAADGKPVDGGLDNSQIVADLLSIGFRHRGFNAEFEHRQPRFTFRIDLSAEEEVVKKRVFENMLKMPERASDILPKSTRGTKGTLPIFSD